MSKIMTNFAAQMEKYSKMFNFTPPVLQMVYLAG